MRKYALDTKLYVHAFRDAARAREFEVFFNAFTPSTYLSTIVLHELLAGSNTNEKAREIERWVAGPLERVGRVFTPSHECWRRAGDALARMAREGKVDLRRVPKSFGFDVLLAVSCRESGVTLVTEDGGDFERIQRYVQFEFVPPWPP
ncbi:MAG: type II toxin-antitoxin system VapC family toxin [Gemmatimonadota bacterium]